MSRIPALLASIVRGVRERAARSDLMVVAAALTCFAGLGLVPLLAAAIRIDAAILGRATMIRTTDGLARYLPGPLHVDLVVRSFGAQAASTPWWSVLVAVFPASIFAEGSVRGLERFSRAPERRSRTLRGRLLTGVLMILAVGVVLFVAGVLRPLLDDPFGTGLGARLLGLFVALNIMFGIVAVLLAVLYRLFATTPVRAGPLAVASLATAAWISGQTLGFLLVLRLAGRVPKGYGDYIPAATVGALAFLVYVEWLVVLLGYLLALRLHEEPVSLHRADRH